MKIEIVLASFLGGVGLFFGSNEEVLKIVIALIIAMAFDILTGVVKALYNKNIKSSKWIDGCIRKMMMLVCVSFCFFVDKYQIVNLGISLESATALFFLAGEVISVFENFVDLGIPLPKVIIDFLAKNTPTSGV